MVAYRVRVVAIAVMLVTVAASCVGSDVDAAPTSSAFGDAASGLCRVSAQTSVDVDEARLEFYNTVHEPLHELATKVSDVDRLLAARLLMAKESVEFGFGNNTDALVASLGELVAAVVASLNMIGDAPPECLSAAQGR